MQSLGKATQDLTFFTIDLQSHIKSGPKCIALEVAGQFKNTYMKEKTKCGEERARLKNMCFQKSHMGYLNVLVGISCVNVCLPFPSSDSAFYRISCLFGDNKDSQKVVTVTNKQPVYETLCLAINPQLLIASASQ